MSINKITKIISIVSSILFAGCNFKTYNETPYDIFIVAGQSNTHAGLVLDRKIDVTNGNIFQLGRYSIYDHIIIPANDPLHHHTIQDDKNGFALNFAKLYDEYHQNENPIVIIPCGFGGSSISRDWYKEGSLYNDLISRTKFVLNNYPNSRIKLFLWHQGEADVGNLNYGDLLDAFITNIRNDLNEENLPFIVGGMVPYWVEQDQNRITQQQIIKETPLRVTNTAYADPEIPFIIEKEDNTFDTIHYSAKGQRELGSRYFDAYLTLLNE